jgi:hypothetical protein
LLIEYSEWGIKVYADLWSVVATGRLAVRTALAAIRDALPPRQSRPRRVRSRQIHLYALLQFPIKGNRDDGRNARHCLTPCPSALKRLHSELTSDIEGQSKSIEVCVKEEFLIK